jgi:uncharacterized membrane protein YeaQ/YmgE (transglycosylase-associated protein family)
MEALVMLGAVSLQPGGIIGWIVVGLIAGWLAGNVMGPGGYGIVGDIVVGLIGALIGGVVVGLVWSGTTGVIGSIVVAFIGACILIALLRALSGSRTASRV